jgi:hypothetical protein
VGVRALLLGPVRPWLAGQSDEIAELGEQSVRVDRQNGHGPRAIVREDQKAVGRVDGQAHAVLAAGRLPIERGQPARLRIDFVRARLFAVTVGRVEELPPLVERQERGIDDSFQDLKLRPVARGRINLVGADPLTVAIALLRGVAADVCERGCLPVTESSDGRR